MAYGYDFEYGDFYCTILSEENKTISITGTSSTIVDDINIPQRVSNNGSIYTIVSIGENAFMGRTQITSVTIPSSVTIIEGQAFDTCTGLKSISIPSSVTSIGAYAFCYCTGLKSISLPSDIASISDYTFCGCTELNSVQIPSKVTSIGVAAFAECRGITNIDIPSSILTIGGGAFSGSGITSITIPSSVTSVGYGAFAGCENLKKVTISDLSAWCNITFEDETSNPLYYAHHLYLNEAEVTNWVIPETTKNIGDYTFCGCTGLTSVTCMWNDPIIANENIFSDATYNGQLYVPIGTKDKYNNTVPWYRFNNIVEKDVSSIESISDETEVVSVIDGTIYISSIKPVRIYNLDGTTIYIGYGACNVNVGKGIYIVRIGNTVQKVIVN